MNTIQGRYLSLAIQPIPRRLAFDGGNSSPLYSGARDLWWRLSRYSRWSKITEHVPAGSASRQLTRSPTLILVLVGNKKLAKWCNACNYDGCVHFSLAIFYFVVYYRKIKIKDKKDKQDEGGAEGAYTLSSQYYSRNTAKNNLVLHWLR